MHSYIASTTHYCINNSMLDLDNACPIHFVCVQGELSIVEIHIQNYSIVSLGRIRTCHLPSHADVGGVTSTEYKINADMAHRLIAHNHRRL